MDTSTSPSDDAATDRLDELVKVAAASLHPWDPGHHVASIAAALDHPAELVAALIERHGHDAVLAHAGGVTRTWTEWRAVGSGGGIALAVAEPERDARARVEESCRRFPTYRLVEVRCNETVAVGTRHAEHLGGT